MSDCVICCNKYNNSNRKKVNCPQCNEICCRECDQKYVLSKDILDCMFCNKIKSFEYLKNSHYNTFINSTGKWKGKGYREHQENIYFKNEMIMFPQTLFEIEKDNKVNKIRVEIHESIIIQNTFEKKIKNIILERKKYCTCQKKFSSCTCAYKERSISSLREHDNLLAEKLLIKIKINELYIELDDINNSIFYNSLNSDIIQKCMSNDCDGYLNNEWKCTKCLKTTCKSCREIKEDHHKCNIDTLNSIKLAESTTKPCPKCSERIHRIYGCDQMYCPLCKVIFSYSSGELQIGGIVHQPDALNELRNNGLLNRDLRDIPCGGVSHIFLSKDTNIFPYLKYPLKIIISILLSWCIEYEDIQIRGLYQPININNLNMAERKIYLIGSISKETFKKKIYNNYKFYEKHTDDRILEAGFYICLSDMLRSLENMKDYNLIYEHITNILNLIKYYNIEFERVNKIYKNNSNPYNFYLLGKKENNMAYFRFVLTNKNNFFETSNKINLEINSILNYNKD